MTIKTVFFSSALLLMALLSSQPLGAEEITKTDKLQHPSVGVLFGANFSKLPDDLNILLQGTSPYFWNRLAFRGSAGIGILQGVPTSSEFSNQIAVTYTVYKAGVIISANQPEDLLRPYTEMGLIMVNLTKALSSTNWSSGVYGTIGMDLLLDAKLPIATFMEFGAAALLSGGKGAAEQFIGNPNLSTGIFIQLGWRYYFY